MQTACGICWKSNFTSSQCASLRSFAIKIIVLLLRLKFVNSVQKILRKHSIIALQKQESLSDFALSIEVVRRTSKKLCSAKKFFYLFDETPSDWIFHSVDGALMTAVWKKAGHSKGRNIGAISRSVMSLS